MDWGDRFFFAVNGSVGVLNLITGNVLVGTLGLGVSLFLITKPLAERR